VALKLKINVCWLISMVSFINLHHIEKA